MAGYDLPFIVNEYIFINAILIFIEIGQVWKMSQNKMA